MSLSNGEVAILTAIIVAGLAYLFIRHVDKLSDKQIADDIKSTVSLGLTDLKGEVQKVGVAAGLTHAAVVAAPTVIPVAPPQVAPVPGAAAPAGTAATT